MDSAPADPIASRIRFLRTSSGRSLRALARSVGDCLARSARGPRGSHTVSASYLSLIESGHKVPDTRIATAIATALGDDPTLYAAWVAVRKRADVTTALAAARRVSEALAAGGEPRSARAAGAMPGAGARLRVPVIREGDDPGDSLRPAGAVAEWIRLDPRGLPAPVREGLARPVAWRVHEDAAHAGGRIAPGTLVLLVRGCLPLDARAVHAVRLPGRVALRRLLWKRGRLVVLPPPGSHDFEILAVDDDAALRRVVVGSVWPIPG